jgi:hypothetical protein
VVSWPWVYGQQSTDTRCNDLRGAEIERDDRTLSRVDVVGGELEDTA